jgi:hypothetical protein
MWKKKNTKLKNKTVKYFRREFHLFREMWSHMHACSLNIIAKGGITQEKLKDWNTKREHKQIKSPWNSFFLPNKQVHLLGLIFTEARNMYRYNKLGRPSKRPLWICLACHFIIKRLVLILTQLLVTWVFFWGSTNVLWLSIFLTVFCLISR